MLQRWRKLRWPARVALIVVVFAVVYPLVTFLQVWRAESWHDDGPADAAVVLGAAQYDGAPSPVLEARLTEALRLYDEGLVDTVVVTGSNQEGDRFTEAYAGLTFLLGKGVDENDVIVVDDGTSTYEQLAATVRVLEPEGQTSVLLVSDPFHSFRLASIAEDVGLDAGVSPVGDSGAVRSLVRETAIVSASRLFGYRRLSNLVG
jgi:vancomycin permeability regulator SanA